MRPGERYRYAMPITAQVVRVLIASPGDVVTERQALREAIWAWNDLHADAMGVVLLPVGWETHTRPELGDHPQHIIDRQAVERADVLVGVFWTRLGTPTPDAASGTVHEIEAFRSSGREVLLYFSDRQTSPSTVNLEQMQAVRDFQKTARHWGLVGSFVDVHDLVDQARSALLRLVRERYGVALDADAMSTSQKPPQVLARVQGRYHEGRFGRLKASGVSTLTLENIGGSTAHNVTLTWEHPAGSLSDKPPRLQGIGSELGIPALAAGSSTDLDVWPSYTQSEWLLRMSWRDDAGRQYQERQPLFVAR